MQPVERRNECVYVRVWCESLAFAICVVIDPHAALFKNLFNYSSTIYKEGKHTHTRNSTLHTKKAWNILRIYILCEYNSTDTVKNTRTRFTTFFLSDTEYYSHRACNYPLLNAILRSCTKKNEKEEREIIEQNRAANDDDNMFSSSAAWRTP